MLGLVDTIDKPISVKVVPSRCYLTPIAATRSASESLTAIRRLDLFSGMAQWPTFLTWGLTDT
jgi:hypothetical protein